MRNIFRLMVLATLIVAVMSGCLKSRDRVVLLQDAIKEYGISIRWSELDFARTLMRPRNGPAIVEVPAIMKLVRVTAWNSGKIVIDPESGEATVDNQFSFYHEASARIIDVGQQQSWYFDVPNNRWYLDGGFPDFAGAWRLSR